MRAVCGLPLGPDSLTWRFFGDHRMALLGPRAAVLQNMLPALGQGVQDHSVWFAETLARLQRSIPPIYDTVYGADPGATGRQVRDFHRPIRGRLPDGSPYSALNPETYYWAHACFVEHLITATDTFIRRLSRAEKEQLFAESITDPKGKIRKRYPQRLVMTPFEKLATLGIVATPGVVHHKLIPPGREDMAEPVEVLRQASHAPRRGLCGVGGTRSAPRVYRAGIG